MIIYPDIELQGGRCVNLIRGKLDAPVVYDIDPVAAAHDFVAAGAEWLHVVDLDAVSGSGDNSEVIREIIYKAGAPVQVAGGIRTLDRIGEWIDAGAARVVIGTAAVKAPDMVKRAARLHPDQIVISIDAHEGHVVVEGWTETSAFTPIDFITAFDGVPLAQIIFTDIDRDFDLPDSSFAQTALIAESTKTPVTASGLVKTLDDVSTLKYIPNIAGVIVGRALFSGALTLEDILALAQVEPEPIASFR